jgi:hypothetical protein
MLDTEVREQLKHEEGQEANEWTAPADSPKSMRLKSEDAGS